MASGTGTERLRGASSREQMGLQEEGVETGRLLQAAGAAGEKALTPAEREKRLGWGGEHRTGGCSSGESGGDMHEDPSRDGAMSHARGAVPWKASKR